MRRRAVLVFLPNAVLWAFGKVAANPDDWYTRYPSYPPYCATPEDMQARLIPEIANDSRLGESRLLHTSVIIRHGARTPWKSFDCWEGYETENVWDCNLTTYLATPPPQRIEQEEGYVSPDGQSSVMLFEKRYDAFSDPGDPLANILHGTCPQGQLLLQGYEQELRNGQNLRNAYIYDGKTHHSERMRLLDTSQSMEELLSQFHYRVDDDQRTIMSGQVLLRGLLGPELIDYWENHEGRHPVLPLHTADRSVDIMAPNEANCPRLAEIHERYENSAAYQTFLQSNETKLLEGFMENVLGRSVGEDYDIIDCLMTTICTDRTLPDSVNDYQTPGRRDLQTENATNSSDDRSDDSSDDGEVDYGTNLFQRLYQYGESPLSMLYRANDAEYAKLGMAPLWSEIMSQIYAVTNEPANGCCPPVTTPAKLALYSAHDTTLMPLLASLGPTVWDGEWAPYASMVSIEIHELHIDGFTDKTLYRSNYAFRLLYNGQVLTSRLDGCAADAELCDVQLLFDQVRSFATRHSGCERQTPAAVVHEDTISRAKEIVSTPEGIVAVCLLVIGSFCMGAASSYFCVKRSGVPRRPRRRNRLKVSTEEDTGDIALTNQNVHVGNGYSDGNDLSNGSGYSDEPAGENFTIT